MASLERNGKKDKNQNIQVFVRLRPLNSRERSIRSIGVVEVVHGREVVVRQSPQTTHTKKFTFDKAFAPGAEQVEVYKEVVSPLIAEVLAGYNCTVFAYGQTGTGKTHTMVGESSTENTTWQDDPMAGIIPRALSQLFDELRVSRVEYTVRVSYLELYNEELFDLLSSAEDNSKLRIYEDVARKGSTIVNGLEEITVYNKNEVYQIMAQGQERKRVASTLMNAQSSNHPKNPNGPRSHTVFTIVVHMKENCPKGEELVKIGKLNLVDLAGSENISKAGSDNPGKKERARECVNINQSLLTLGRVITALVEKHPHIPYRESKLTRILQESLGGRTKTSIIATISPGHKDLEETMSTLEYAHRAKNIQNKPEVNQKLTKQAILKDFAEEIDKLKRELTTAREKNGVYLPSDVYDEMTAKSMEQRQEIQELLLKKRAMEEERERMQTVFMDLERTHQQVQADLGETKAQLDTTAAALEETAQRRLEAEHLVSRHMATESNLSQQARTIMAAAARATQDANSLHDTVDRRKNVESTNMEVVMSYREQSTAQRSRMLDGVADFAERFSGVRQTIQAAIDDHTRDLSMSLESTIQDAGLVTARLDHFNNQMNSLTTERTMEMSSAVARLDSTLESSSHARRQALEEMLVMLVQAVSSGVDQAEAVGDNHTIANSINQWMSGAMDRMASLQRVHSAYSSGARQSEEKRAEGARRQGGERAARGQARDGDIAHCIQEIEKDMEAIKKRMASQLGMMENEKEETENRLRQWMEEERLRLQRHVEEERNALNKRIQRHMSVLEEQRQLLAELAAKLTGLREVQLQRTKEEMEAEQLYEELRAAERSEREARLRNYGKEFEEGTLAIAVDTETFGNSLVQVAEHTMGEVIDRLRDARGQLQQATEEVSSNDLESNQQCSRSIREAVTGVIDNATNALTTVAQNTQEAVSSAVLTLAAVSERASTSEAASQSHQAAVTAAVSTAGELVSEMTNQQREQMAAHEELEGRYLMREYRVYSPTGNTPMRRDYRYPRRLVATSPHDRILARLRAQRYNGNDAVDSPVQDVVVVDSDDGRHTSDSDEVSESSGVSEDSAVDVRRH